MKHEEILAYLKETFPPGEVMPHRDYASTMAPVFPVVENYVERQLEVDRALLDDVSRPIVGLMRSKRVAETMREHPGKRVLVHRASDGTLLVDIEALRKHGRSGSDKPGPRGEAP